MNTYKHSVSLDESKCKGCTTCLKRCPTEAIRIRDGRAIINAQKCIDCGECVRVCPHKAKKAVHDTFDSLKDYKYKIALPAPSLYGQFANLDNIGYVIGGLKEIKYATLMKTNPENSLEALQMVVPPRHRKAGDQLCLSRRFPHYQYEFPVPL